MTGKRHNNQCKRRRKKLFRCFLFLFPRPDWEEEEKKTFGQSVESIRGPKKTFLFLLHCVRSLGLLRTYQKKIYSFSLTVALLHLLLLRLRRWWSRLRGIILLLLLMADGDGVLKSHRRRRRKRQRGRQSRLVIRVGAAFVVCRRRLGEKVVKVRHL